MSEKITKMTSVISEVSESDHPRWMGSSITEKIITSINTSLLSTQSCLIFRKRAINNGFKGLIRVPTGQKSPRDKNWTDGSSLNQLLNPSNEYLNTGLLCSGLRVIDVDVEDEKQAHEIEETAQRIIGSIGPKRYRDNSNKFAIVYRAKKKR